MIVTLHPSELLSASTDSPFASIPEIEAGSCVVIGNFDGVHRGHLALFSHARKSGLPVIAVTFDPHPREVLTSSAPPRLLSTPDRLELLTLAGAEHILLLAFTKTLATLSPDRFVREILLDRLNMRRLIIGYDFSLGRGRAGNSDTLRLLGAKMGFTVEQLPGITAPEGGFISSTRIRESLQNGNVELASVLLGRAHTVRGMVIHGFHRGHALGFPTANLAPDLPGMEAVRLASPGVYATRVLLPAPDGQLPSVQLTTRQIGCTPDGAEVRPAVTSIGYNPTFEGSMLSIETHIPGIKRSLYNLPIELAFIRRLRDQIKFSSLNELTHQIQHDTAEAVRLAG